MYSGSSALLNSNVSDKCKVGVMIFCRGDGSLNIAIHVVILM